MNSLNIILLLVIFVSLLMLVNELKTRPLDESGRTKRKATPHHSFRWPGARIHFLIRNSSEPDIDVIMRAMYIWEQDTCLEFIPILSESQLFSTTGNRVVYFKGENCWADVGRHGYPEQYISIGPGCNSLNIVLHEIGHTIGFEHEHERGDRDDYVRVNWLNVEKENADAFQRKDTIMTVPYDIYSIMHYSRDVIILSSGAYCGYRRPCQNKGYIGPACNCLCPPGFYGKQCELGAAQKLLGCRQQLTNQSGIIQSPNFPGSYGNWEDCIWYIKAPEGRTITLTFLEFDLEDSPFCYRDYLGIRTKNMYQDESSRFCGNQIPPTITTSKNEMMIFFISDYMINSRGFKAKYAFNSYGIQRNDDNANCFQRSCYEFLNQQVSHWEAKRLCQLRGTRLLMISSPEENEFLRQRFGEQLIGSSFWVDFPYNINERERGWKWAKDWYEYIRHSRTKCCRYVVYDDWKRVHCYDRGQNVICEKEVPEYIHPKWNKWSNWNACTVTCGGGTRTRTRSCTLPGLCKGLANGTKVCNTVQCPGSFAQGKWTNQSSMQADSDKAVDSKYWIRELDGSCSLTEYEWEPWWVVDLGKSQTVVKLVITIDAQRLYRLDDTVVRVGGSLSELRSNYQCRESITEKDIHSYRVNMECNPTPKGRYLSLQKENKYGVINICEIDVFVSALNCPFEQPYLGFSLPSAKGIPVFWKDPTIATKEKLGKISCSHISGSVFPIGQTQVTCKTQKSSVTYQNLCSFLVNVEVCKHKFKSKCYKLFSDKQTYVESSERCRRIGFEIATAKTPEENAYIRGMMSTTLSNGSYAFLSRDVVFQKSSESLQTGKNSTFSNWSESQPGAYLSRPEHQQCVVIETQTGKWLGEKCKYQQASVCEAQFTSCRHKFNDSCYYALKSKQNYESSRELCKDIGGELVTVRSAAENTYIKSLLKGEAFIGLKISGPENTWKWSDSTALTYTKWIKGYPKKNGGGIYPKRKGGENNSKKNGVEKECVILKSSGRWKNVSCNQRNLAVCRTRII
ncbi:uncharacterized protein LOC117101883 [Anneissia japonica]|uniref:uncharacterized protein LOC117101883 n=1 Tax=Anneissia japonica TaxID=1529436 RepID=UPI00142561D8|nr:uncharacterized protein LOC117101883 [Anneissia japonica]